MKLLKTALGIALGLFAVSMLLIGLGFVLFALMIAVPSSILLDSAIIYKLREQETECEREN